MANMNTCEAQYSSELIFALADTDTDGTSVSSADNDQTEGVSVSSAGEVAPASIDFFSVLHDPIEEVLGQVTGKKGVKVDKLALVTVLKILVRGLEHIAIEAAKAALADHDDSPLVCVRVHHMEGSVRNFLQEELGKHAVSEFHKAIKKAETNDAGEDFIPLQMPRSYAKSPGLVFPMGFVFLALAEVCAAEGVGALTHHSAVGLAAVLEYLTAEILELASGGERSELSVDRPLNFADVERGTVNDAELKSLVVERMGLGFDPLT